MTEVDILGPDGQPLNGEVPKTIVLPDGSEVEVHQPEPEAPTRADLLRAEVHMSSPMIHAMYKVHKHIVRATVVEALAMRNMAERAGLR